MRKSGIFYVVAAVVTLQTILVLTNLRTQFSKPNHKESPRKSHLLILSTWRSGSSLVGQLFNQHPDVFYLKEPAWNVWKTMPHNNAHVLHMSVRDLIRSVFKCDMSVFDVYLKNRRNVSNLFQWSSSKGLCSPPACNYFSRDQIVTQTECIKKCGKNPFHKVEQSCNTYSHVVLQEFRIFDLKVLYPLLKDPSLNLKILHIVRDPRALAKSRLKLKFALKFDNAVILNSRKGNVTNNGNDQALEEICRSQVEMYKATNVQPPSFLKNRYILFRYDDLVRDPLRIANEMYAFAGLTMTEKLKNWIYKMTKGDELHHAKPFSITSRDAFAVSLAWRNVLTFKEIKLVQKVCKDFMDYFRYQNIDSQRELSDFNVETVLPRNREDFQWEKYNSIE